MVHIIITNILEILCIIAIILIHSTKGKIVNGNPLISLELDYGLVFLSVSQEGRVITRTNVKTSHSVIDEVSTSE